MATPQSLETRIAKLSLSLSRKAEKANGRELLYISIAVSLLGQAQLMIESNQVLAQMLYSRANTLGNTRDTEAMDGRR